MIHVRFLVGQVQHRQAAFVFEITGQHGRIQLVHAAERTRCATLRNHHRLWCGCCCCVAIEHLHHRHSVVNAKLEHDARSVWRTVHLEQAERVQNAGDGGVVRTVHPHAAIRPQTIDRTVRESIQHVLQQKAGVKTGQQRRRGFGGERSGRDPSHVTARKDGVRPVRQSVQRFTDYVWGKNIYESLHLRFVVQLLDEECIVEVQHVCE